ncbi:tetratricopeptide (TPR) repeat protein [Rhodanobacter sp. ANJX3]|uniref:tetratricopeptide repeat-containing sulfotransferase family protein n=1 Tax=unclassified Rhodanobacter TaxID=2621553 RepID=UPI0015CB8871|nr:MULTISPECIES: tetratricopeptide repeat-containing sulfotransferase family protein [unclassified Rhodanobacter]MBB5359765.1 tetratricopeptide (TPR) repeat protein [Rhodanobacter sp. ANJX3]NYE28680.1 tetratricopeptide (TPR) repeat protein [Rhodanobacter sp. K2T2]
MSAHPTSTHISQWMAEAGRALGQGKLDDAERLLKQALAANPVLADARYLYGITCLMRGQAVEAVDWLRKAVEQRPADANMRTYLGCALHDAGAFDEALIHLRRACELAPQQAKLRYNLGKALKERGQLSDADEAFRHTLTLDPQHVLARLGVADIATMQGDIPGAVAEYRHVLRQQPGRAEAWHGLANLKTEPLGPADIGLIQQALGQPNLPPDTRVMLGFSLFRALEDQHDYAGAFDALRQANAEKRRQVQWDAAAEQAQIDRIIEAFQGRLPAPPDATLGKEVIFIASMPRSGSTLVEHILATHPEVEGANEIADLPQVIEDESRRRGQPFPQWVTAATADDWHRLGQDYLTRTARWRERRPRFTDKNVVNWPLLGAARLMLPGAKIIQCHRDPVETCFSGYRQLFRDGLHYSYNLEEMAEHYHDYQRLSAFWLTRHPQHVLDFPYEILVQQPEPQIRRLLAFCDLTFDAACLTPHHTKREVLSTASAAQVREPIRADTAHSAPYLEWLQPLRQRLSKQT